MNPLPLPLAMGKWYGRQGYLTSIRQPIEKKKNSEFKTGVLRLKIDFTSNPVRGGEVNGL